MTNQPEDLIAHEPNNDSVNSGGDLSSPETAVDPDQMDASPEKDLMAENSQATSATSLYKTEKLTQSDLSGILNETSKPTSSPRRSARQSQNHQYGQNGRDQNNQNSQSQRGQNSPKTIQNSTTVTEQQMDEYKGIALKLFREEFLLISFEEYTQFLASLDPESAIICELYMDLFHWNKNLLDATRMLCKRLHLKGESQEIDRILSAFTRAYLKQNPDNVFCTQDFEQIYIIIYSLILLNTNLHNAEVGKKSKISEKDYIANTLSTFVQQNRASALLSVKQRIQIERELALYYDALLREQLFLKRGDSASKRQLVASKRLSVADTIFSENSGLYDDAEPRMSNAAAYDEALFGGNNQNSHSSSYSGHNGHNVHNAHSHGSGNGHINNYNHDNYNNSPFFNGNSNNGHSARAPNTLVFGSSNSAYEAGRPLPATTHNSTFMDRRAFSKSGANPALHSAPAKASNRQSPHSSFGFTRALASEVPPNRALAASSLRAAQNDANLNHRSLRASLMTKDSRVSLEHGDDLFSMVSVDDATGFNIDLGTQKPYEQEDFDINDFQDRVDLKLELQGAPYLKEGLLKLRVLNNDNLNFSATSDGHESNDVASMLEMSIGSQRSGVFGFFRSFTSAKQSKPKASAAHSSVSGSGGLFNKPVEYFVVVSKGELRLYSFDPKLVKKQQRKQQKLSFWAPAEEDIGDGNWLKNAANVGNYNLCSTVARFERVPTTNGGWKPVWTLVFPKVSKKPQKRFVFEAGTPEVATEFVNTCNFWASKITAIPALEETISSIEYGWTDLDALQRTYEGFKKTKAIVKWESLPKGVYFSNYVLPGNGSDEDDHNRGIMKQFLQTLKYYNHLKSLYMQFLRQKVKFVKTFRRYAGCSNYTLVINNFEQKLQEYKAELTRYKSYIIMLAYGLKLRLDMEDEDDKSGSDVVRDDGEDEDEDDKDSQFYESNASLSDHDRTQKEPIGNDDDTKKQDELKTIVIREINKLLNTSSEMNRLFANDPNYKAEVVSQNGENVIPMTKSPKTFSFSTLTDFDSSPIKQLLSIDNKPTELVEAELIKSFSTTTIKEEDEPEEAK